MARTKSLLRNLFALFPTIALASAAQAGVGPTPTAGATPTATATAGATPTATATATAVPTPTATATATAVPMPTATATAGGTPTATATATAVPTPTATATATAVPTPTATGSPVPTPTSTATATAVPTPTATATSTSSGSPTPTSTFVPTPTATATSSPSPTATSTSSPSPTSTATATPTPTAPPVGLDHFLCYKAGNAWGYDIFERRDVDLSDQFQSRTVTLTRPSQYCNPVDKNGEGIDNPDMHLTCYLTKQSSRVKPEVRTMDQFGEQYLTVLRQRSQVCVPTTQIGSEQAVTAAAIATVDHFDMYRAKTTPRTPRFERQDVTVEDQWIDETVTVKKPWRLGVPTDKNEEGIGDPDTHLNCYLLKAPSFKRRDVQISNQFGDFVLTVRRPQSLCVPSDKEVVGDDR